MIMETQEQQIRYLENYFEARCNKLNDEGKKSDALSLYEEMVVDEKDPEDYLFISLHRSR